MRHTKLLTGVVGVTALVLLSACSADDSTEQPPADQPTQEQTADTEATSEETSAATPADNGTNATSTDDATTSDTTDDAQASGDATVFDIIGFVEAEYEGGVIVDIDREDDGSTYDVDVVLDSELHELDVTTGGDITEDERQTDDDKIDRADRATVTVTEALNQAFEQHADATLDQIDLDDDDASLKWEIELDGADGADIELDVPAT